LLLDKVALRVRDDDVMRLLRLILKASGKQGVPQGGVISALLSNLYLTEVDRMLERAKTVTTRLGYTAVEYTRFADDLVVLVDAHPRHAWLKKSVPVLNFLPTRVQTLRRRRARVCAGSKRMFRRSGKDLKSASDSSWGSASRRQLCHNRPEAVGKTLSRPEGSVCAMNTW